MRWLGGDQEGNIEDRRGLGPVGVGGLGAGGVVLALIGYFVFGISPSTTMDAVNGVQAQQGYDQQDGFRGQPKDQAGQFVDVISTNVDEVWRGLFRQNGQTYTQPAAIVLYDQSTGTGCGLGQGAMGPFYCPADQKVYIDLNFYETLKTRLGAPGDFAQAYVIAHEVGHAAQHRSGDPQMALRQLIVPVASLGSSLAPWLIIAGVIFKVMGLAVAGLVFFAAAVVFTFVTLPVEFGASRRALAYVEPLGLNGERADGARSVLRAAGWTYVAAALTALLTFLYYLWLVFGSRR